MSKAVDCFLRIVAVILLIEWAIMTALTPGGFFMFIAPWLAFLSWVLGSHNAKVDGPTVKGGSSE